ncbi:hypothetical protein O4215_20600 [Rhodococcus maanshanensis]|uniref:hypothetical protein n=1 Tax=Rhodococcus maanshanensis TaxID=183556 RepID=UPI0022B546DB|nr:hypothetical protein [Rhodococcus maanshanensis]MCZ4557965.1 hypothetical protein [Rhodococcus maanshanensis]
MTAPAPTSTLSAAASKRRADAIVATAQALREFDKTARAASLKVREFDQAHAVVDRLAAAGYIDLEQAAE